SHVLLSPPSFRYNVNSQHSTVNSQQSTVNSQQSSVISHVLLSPPSFRYNVNSPIEDGRRKMEELTANSKQLTACPKSPLLG
ncbi:MAG: hypothetical protein WBA89_28595, partial [Microcoleus sp.]|uniref:hypothetical protein n=1 Tax=Microcoleus sp. TaxID=44472 RepID=UPI003C7506A5